VLAIVAYKQPTARAGIERVRSTNSDGALETIIMRDLADLTSLQELAADDAVQAWAASGN